MEPITEVLEITCAASTTQTLPRPVIRVEGATYANGVATAGSVVKAASLTPVAGTNPTSTQIRFDGVPTAPSATVKLLTKAVAGVALRVRVVPIGGLPV